MKIPKNKSKKACNSSSFKLAVHAFKVLQNQLFDEIASTKIDENGIAETGSLREIEVVKR